MELDVHPELIPPDGGEVVSDTGTWRLELLSDHEPLHVTLFDVASGESGPPLHVHHLHADAFYVLAGELTMPLGPAGEPEQLPAGSFALAPPLLAHAFRPDRGDTRFLNFHAPGTGFAQRLRAPEGERPPFDQHEPPPDGGRPRADAVIGRGELLSDTPALRVALLADVEQLAIAEVWSEPGGAAPPAHVHEHHAEFFYVLAGEITFRFGDREVPAGPGTWAHVPAGVAHTFELRGGEQARFLDIHAPSRGFGDFVRALHRARGEDELAAARAAFDQVPA